MTEFSNILKYTLSKDKEKKELLNDISFKQGVSKTKRLLITQADDYSELLVTEITKVIQDGAMERRCMRDVIPVLPVPDGFTSKITYGITPNLYAGYVAEGSEVPIVVDDYSTRTITLKKVAERPLITGEMVEDNRVGVIERELKACGARLENKLNQEVIGTLLDGAHGTTPEDIDPDGTHTDIADISMAYGDLCDTGWKPNKLVLHPKVVGYVESDMGYQVNFNNGNLWDMDTHILNATVDETKTNHWLDTDAATNYTGLVLDSTNYATICMNQDISVDKFDDPINDLVGIIVSMRFGVGCLNDTAAVRILAK